MNKLRQPLIVIALSVGGFAALGPSSALAHPLGNFSVNHLNRLSVTSSRFVDDATMDIAEIPTAQNAPEVDTDGDGSTSAQELQSYAQLRCADWAKDLSFTLDRITNPLSVTQSRFAYREGQAGLNTGRLDCRFEANIAVRSLQQLAFSDNHLPDRVGWKEITAVGSGIQLVDAQVAATSVTDGLTTYPMDLLDSPMDVRNTSFQVQPLLDNTAAAQPAAASIVPQARGFWSGAVDRVQGSFDDLIGKRDLTVGVGLLAVALAILLGASHALLPGHGKTVMAAYIAGRQGSVRDAVLVGATVTGTHTGGVLLLGLALTLSSSLAGESVLAWLGVTSGLMIAALGLGLLWSARKHGANSVFAHGHSHAYGFDDHHDHDHHEHDHHEHDHHEHDHHEHDHHEHDHHEHDHHEHDHHEHDHHEHDHHGHDHHEHDHHGHDHHGHDHQVVAATVGSTAVLTRAVPTAVSRRALVGMGIAGGLVPSPSALVILLSAIALGRTWFGVLLVLGYGLGMAATLTAAGVLLVRVRDRYQHRIRSTTSRVGTLARRWGKLAPFVTGALVAIVGIGLVLRSMNGL